MKFAGYVLYVMGLVVLLNSCEGCKSDYGPYKPMSAEFKSCTVFPKGSYWIYKDSASALLDSIMEYDTHNDRLGGNPRSFYSYDNWIFYYNSSHQSSFNCGSYLRLNLRSQKEYYSYLFSEDAKSGSYDFYPVYFDADTLNSTWEYSDNVGGVAGVTYKELIPSITIGSNVFTDVRVFEQSKLLSDSPNTLTRRIYIAKNVGIIRRELFNGEVWELQKYFINN